MSAALPGVSETVCTAAAESMAQAYLAGSTWIRSDGNTATSRFAIDTRLRRCAEVIGFLLKSRQAPFWQRTVTDHSALYTPRGSEVYGSDPADPPDRHDAWIRTQGVDFAAIPAVSTLHWLRGTVKADEVDESRFTVRLDREKSILSSSAEDRPGVVESWGQVPELSSVTGTVLLADSNVKRVELTLSPQHKLSIDYEQTVHQTVIPLPEEFEPIELTTLLHGLGVSVRSQRPDPPSV